MEILRGAFSGIISQDELSKMVLGFSTRWMESVTINSLIDTSLDLSGQVQRKESIFREFRNQESRKRKLQALLKTTMIWLVPLGTVDTKVGSNFEVVRNRKFY